MNVSTRWLKEMVPGLEGTPARLAEHLALRGAPVDAISSPGEELGDIVIGRVISAKQHPNADRLSVCEVDGGDGIVQVVCGAPNVKGGTLYPFAPVGAVLPGDFKIKKAKIRGEVSQGMLCSAKELGLGIDHDGILELEGDYAPGTSFVDALGLDDATLDVEITANRGDLLSHAGVARELASEGEGRVELASIPDAKPFEAEYIEAAPVVEAGGVSIRIEDPDLCHRYLGAVIRGVTIGPSPAWLQERLRGAGARPINNVVDATNYVMLELGQPLHAFDLARLAGSGIVVRRPAAGEKEFTTLDSEKRTLSDSMLLICDTERPVAIGGVMGGLDSEVEDTTTDILLECALFEPKSIRATRKALNMSTDASYRYERGVDPDGLRAGIERAIQVILATAGGELDGPVLDCRPVPFENAVVDLRVARVERLLGIPFEADYLTELLTPLGFAVEGETDGVLHVRIPGFRSYDVTREVDLIEEVARTHGFDNFPDALGAARPGSVPDHPLFQLEDALRIALVGHGFFESQTPAFAPAGEGDVEVSNPLATTEPYMRAALLPSLLRRVEYNLAHGNRDVRLFEVGTSFTRAGAGAPPHEEAHIGVVFTGRRSPPHWSREDEPFTVWDLKGLLEDTVRRVYRADATVTPLVPGAPSDGAGSDSAGDSPASSGEREASSGSSAPGSAGRAAVSARLDPDVTFVVTAGTTPLGAGGRVRAEAVDLPPWAGEVWAFEFVLPAHPVAAPEVTYQPRPQFPASERDLALLVPRSTASALVSDAISKNAGDALESLELFDVYEGEGIPEGTRSLAYRLRFRSQKRTLKDKEVDRSVRTVLKRLEEDFGVKARG